MMPHDPKDDLANEWLNNLVNKLRFEQDYYVFPGSSKPLVDADGNKTGISIKRPDIRLYSTGVTKLYEMLVEAKELPDVVYTDEEEEQFDKNMLERYPELKEASTPKAEKG